MRLIVPLARADAVIQSEVGKDAVYLLRFPETAVRILILGARIDDKQVEAVVRQAKATESVGSSTCLSGTLERKRIRAHIR
jgi:hypothetical protein